MPRLPVFAASAASLLAGCALANSEPEEKYFVGWDYRQCTASNDRCVGEHQKHYVLWAPCCNPEDTCAEDKSKNSWGLFCTRNGQKCYEKGQKCAGSADHFIYQKPCCGEMDCVEDTEAGWGAVCWPRGGGDHVSDAAPPQAPDQNSYDAQVTHAPVATEALYKATPAPFVAEPEEEAGQTSTAQPSTQAPQVYTSAPTAAPTEAYVEPQATAAQTQAQTEAQEQSQSDGAPCGSWVGKDGKVVISVANSGYGKWQNEGDGIKWDAGNWDPHMTVEPSDPIAYKWVAPQAGKYVITALTSSPHSTEHNDMWLKVPGGVALEKPGNSMGMKYDWEKAYSNGMANSMVLSAVDNDPHFFATGHVEAGSTNTIEIAGRSSQFKVHKIMVLACGGECTTYETMVREGLNDLTTSEFKSC